MKIKIDIEETSSITDVIYYEIYIKRHWYNRWRKIYKSDSINNTKRMFNELKDNKYYLANIFNSKDDIGSVIEIL